MSERYDYLTMEHSKYGGISVHGWGTYEENSVLAGQAKKQFLDSFDTVEEAKAAYPEVEMSHPMLQPQNTFDHLPDGPDDLPDEEDRGMKL
jgi:hypothetical protein